MGYKKRLNNAFKNAPRLPLNEHTKYVFFSDCHRGIGNTNDNFLKNANSYLAALQYYDYYDFCYIEAGDGDELWENKCFDEILEIHNEIFSRLCMFYEKKHLYMLYGNHDIVKRNKAEKLLDFPVYEGLLLHSEHPNLSLKITHGHQADLLNSTFWPLARFLVRYIWTPLERLGVSDPTSAAKSNTKKKKMEKRYLDYASKDGCLLLTGHTHRASLGSLNSPYFNCGSSVHPKCVTCIELEGYEIRLVKWCSSVERYEQSGTMCTHCSTIYPVYIKREVLAVSCLLQ